MKKYKLIDHTADIGCEIFGKSRKELFANGVAALFNIMLEQNSDWGKSLVQTMQESLEEKRITIAGNDLEDLLINFLREALYLFNGEKWVVIGCETMELTTNHIVAQLSGEPYNPKNHQVKMEIKAVTYHSLSISKTKAGWVARVIFDV